MRVLFDTSVLVPAVVDQLAIGTRTPENDYADAIRRVSQGGFASGVVYDALHVCCAERIPVDRILTANLADFERLRPAGVVVAAP